MGVAAARRGGRRERRGRRGRRLPGDPGPVRRHAVRRRRRRHRRPTSAHSGTTAMQWCMPFGVLTPASWMALNATRYMHAYGVTERRLRAGGRPAARLRRHQPAAWGYRAADHPRGPPGVALDRRALHPALRLLPGDRRLGRPRHHQPASAPPTLPSRPVMIAAAAAPGSSSRRSPPTTTAPTCRSWRARSPWPGGSSTRSGYRPRRHRRRDDLRRLLADPADAARGPRASAASARPRTSSPTATSPWTARSRATPTAA